MDFTFSPEQEQMRSAARSFLERLSSSGYPRAMIDDPAGFSAGWWAEICELGWPSALVPERLGGAGLGLLDVVVIQEEMGRVPMPGPFLSSAVAATLAALHLGDEELLQQLASGARRATVAFEEGGGSAPLQSVQATAEPDGEEWVLQGTKPVVLDGHTADLAIVAAREPAGLAAFVLEEPGGTPVPTLDVTRKVARVELTGRRARRAGPEGDQTALLERVCDDIAVALCAESVGASERALQMAVDYAKQRVQFDRPIASFQAIRHKTVDMLHQLELARAATHWAAWASQAGDPAAEAAAAACKSFVSEAAVKITGECIQVHGGLGFTWDVDCHLLFRRVKQNDVLFGSQAWNRRRLAGLILDPPPPGRF